MQISWPAMTEPTNPRLSRHPDVMHGALVIAGTRIPVSAIKNYNRAGFSNHLIMDEYPGLTWDDVVAALAHRDGDERSTDMIELVAKALYELDEGEADGLFDVTKHDGSCVGNVRACFLCTANHYRGLARAARKAVLLELREPTEEMKVAGTEQWLCVEAMEDRSGANWRAMIDAALEEEPDRQRVRCAHCGGSGAVPEESTEGYTGREITCPNCNGSGDRDD